MKIIIRRSFPVAGRTQRWLRWSRRLLFAGGMAALGYVGFTLLEAAHYQASAKASLETQIRMAKTPDRSTVQKPIKSGDVLGRMDIPRLGISVAVLQGTSSRTLRLGAGHMEGTPLPGTPGNSGIAGHRDTFFRELRNIRDHDEIQIQTATGLVRYQVDWVKIVGPEDTTVLTGKARESTLTLVTCYPFYFVGPAPNRFVVHARQDQPSFPTVQNGTVIPPRGD